MTGSLNYKKILLSASIIAFVSAMVFGGTQAFFSDEETSTGNTFTAGAIDLQIDNSSYGFDWNRPGENDPTGVWGENPDNSWELDDLTDQLFFSFVDLKPGDYGEDTISLHVNDNDAWACMAFNLTDTPENDINGPEEDAGDVTEDEGELQNYLSFIFWWDDGDNVLEDGEVVIPELSGLPGSIFGGDWLPIAEAGDDPLEGGSTHYIGKGWCFGDITAEPVDRDPENNDPPTADVTGFTCDGSGDHNDAQTDGIEVDVAFHAEQSRNNDQFACSELPPLEDGGEQRPFVGANLASYTQSDPCEVTVGVDDANYSTIQAAIDGEDADTVICVDDGTYEEDVLINKNGIVLSGAGASNSSVINGQSPNFGGALVIDADNVTVEGFVINGAENSQHAVRFATGISGATFQDNQVNAPNGGNALLAQGNQSGHVIQNNELVGDASPQVAYVNGDASLSQPSDDIDFIGNTFAGTIVSGGLALGIESTNSNVMNNVFESTFSSSYAWTEFWEDDALVNQNNFNGASADTKLINSDPSQNDLNAENNWWGDNDPADNVSSAVDFTPHANSAFPEN